MLQSWPCCHQVASEQPCSVQCLLALESKNILLFCLLHRWFGSKREQANSVETKLAPGYANNFHRVWSLLKRGCLLFSELWMLPRTDAWIEDPSVKPSTATYAICLQRQLSITVSPLEDIATPDHSALRHAAPRTYSHAIPTLLRSPTRAELSYHHVQLLGYLH